MDIIITYKSGHKRIEKNCSFLELNPWDKPRGMCYEKTDKDGHDLCYDDVLLDKVAKVEIIMKE